MNLSKLPFVRLFKKKEIAPKAFVMQLVEQRTLGTVFQPIANLRDAEVCGHEAYIRGPRLIDLQMPQALLHAAKMALRQQSFELACVEFALEQWARERRVGRLFINISASSLVSLEGSVPSGALQQLILKYGISPQRVVFEITEHRHFDNVLGLRKAVHHVRAAGARVALDDMRGSASSIKLWFKLAPEFVKLEASLTHGIAANEGKARPVRSLVGLANRFGSTLVAKEVENEGDLLVLKALGVQMAQGFFIGSPDVDPVEALNRRAYSVLSEADPSVPPSMKMH
jgi:EAL domain-containing protein (putative c-di-GMP-specific phosphodiesterase class I)